MEKRTSVLLLSALPVGLAVVLLAMKRAEVPAAEALEPKEAIAITARANAKLADQKTAPTPQRNIDWSSGPRNSLELDEEWSQWAGQERGQPLPEIQLKEDLRLTMVLTEFVDLSKNPLRVQHVQSMGIKGGTAEGESATYYSRQIDGLEEKNIRLSLQIPHSLKKSRQGLGASLSDKGLFTFGLKQSILKRPFDRRSPAGLVDFMVSAPTDFDPISVLVTEDPDEAELYEADVAWNGQIFTVQAEGRETDLGTFVLELQIRPLDSLQSYKLALVYE